MDGINSPAETIFVKLVFFCFIFYFILFFLKEQKKRLPFKICRVLLFRVCGDYKNMYNIAVLFLCLKYIADSSVWRVLNIFMLMDA